MTLQKAMQTSNALYGLHDMRDGLAVVSACLVLCKEGTARASATEIAVKVSGNYHTRFEPIIVGQILRKLGINTAISRGRSKFILEPKQLQPLVKRYTEAIRTGEKEVRSLLSEFSGINEDIAALDKEWAAISKARVRVRELKEQNAVYRHALLEQPIVENENTRLQAQVDRMNQEKERRDKLQAMALRLSGIG